jgi:predicted alpha-1,6-mannanase (GH76 family)
MTEPDYRACAAAGIGALQRWYRPLEGQWATTGWWNSANALTALIGYTRWTGDRGHARAIRQTFRRARWQHRHFINRYYDDNAWWALAWIAAYDLTSERRYLQAAQLIFSRSIAGWDDTCRGGLWWNEDRRYKNAISNELFITLAARLDQRAPDTGDGYRAWALRAWDWFRDSGMIGPNGLVNDGLTPSCENNGGPTWTYNQGVILGGLAALYEITADRGYLDQGEIIADAALSHLTSPPSAGVPGILSEPGETTLTPDGDQTQFKGIFVRYLHDFWRQDPRPAYRSFILANARSIWDNDRNANDQFGFRWAGPFDRADASRQSSALDALNAAVALTGDPGQSRGRPVS